MQRTIFISILILCAVIVSVYFARFPGYVHISLQHWQLQIPLWAAFLLTIALSAVFYLLFWVVHTLFMLNQSIARWFKREKLQHGHQALQQGILALLAEQFSEAQARLDEAAVCQADPIFTQLALAFVAQKQADYQRRDNCFKQLQSKNPTEQIQLGLLQARLQIDSGEFTQALAKLNSLRLIDTSHPRILQLLANVYYQQHQLIALSELLPALKKYQAIDIQTYIDYLTVITKARLLNSPDKQNLLAVWSSTVDVVQKQMEVLQTYVQQLLHYNLTRDAEMAVRLRIKQQASDELYLLYASIPADEHQQILQIETWLHQQPASATLLFAAGSVCMRLQLWGKARDYFLASWQQNPTVQTCGQLASAFVHLKEYEQAIYYYRQALLIKSKFSS